MVNTDNEAGMQKKPSEQKLQDMLMQLERDQRVRLGTGGMTFDVSYCKGDTNKLPHRRTGKPGTSPMSPAPPLIAYSDNENELIEDIFENSTGQTKDGVFAQQIKYTAAEKEVLAELFRDDILRERRDKSRQTTAAKHALAAHRRADLVSSQFDQQPPTDNCTPERMNRVKGMTDEHMNKVRELYK